LMREETDLGEVDVTEAPPPAPTQHRTVRRALLLTEEEDEILAENVRKRYLPSRAEYLRMLIEKDALGDLLVMDDAIIKMARTVGEAFGGAAGQYTAEADRVLLERWRCG
jgi:hypothetical protein